MIIINKALSDALNTALNFEKKGRAIYEEAAKNTANPIVAKTFSYLAEQETFHVEEIHNYLNTNRLEFLGDRPENTQKFFSTTISEFKKKTKLSADDIKAHATAIELEKNSYNFYKDEYYNTKDPELKQFFEFLMKQEKTHYELVKKTLDYIQDPAAFFRDQESWIFEGG